MPPVGTSTPHAPSVARTCAAILNLLLPHRRATDPDLPAPVEAFPGQLRQLADFVTAGDQIVFTLPGFPCKSPAPPRSWAISPTRANGSPSASSTASARPSRRSTRPARVW